MVLLILLYLSDSRTSLYGIIIFELLMLYNLIFKNKTSKIILSLLLFPIFLISVTYFTKDISVENLNFLLSNRLYLWTEAIETLNYNDRFFIGMGSYLNSQISQYDLTLIDNGYIYMVFQNGIISLSIMLLLFSLILVFLWKNTNDFNGIFNFCLFVLYLFVGIFENSLFNLSNLMTIFVLSNVYHFIKCSRFESKRKDELYENCA
ncbi:O-antigen ligase family protein [Exiguobacterium chiriqhucha]|uniref:O-antigen ligase family protein n=1 Tax=Exiguobacterium chiriqhucha TaxID=1385984 RepID=UPI003B836B38